MRYERNAEELKEAIYRHSPVGQKVVVPIFGEAVVVDQDATNPVRHRTPTAESLGNPMVYYKVKAKTPVPFMKWVEGRRKGATRGSATTPYDLEEWNGLGGPPSHTPYYLMDQLQAGGRLSWADIEHAELQGRGCIDADDRVFCYTFWSNDVHIAPQQLEKGRLVEYTYRIEVKRDVSEDRIMQGRILGFGKFPGTEDDVAFFEFFTPTPYLELPNALANPMIQEDFYSKGTYAIGYGTHEAMELAQEESGEDLIPPGKWDTHKRIFTLKEFLPLSVIEDLCKIYESEGGWCFWQSLIMYVVPVQLYNDKYPGVWHPLPKVRGTAVDFEVLSYDLEE